LIALGDDSRVYVLLIAESNPIELDLIVFDLIHWIGLHCIGMDWIGLAWDDTYTERDKTREGRENCE